MGTPYRHGPRPGPRRALRSAQAPPVSCTAQPSASAADNTARSGQPRALRCGRGVVVLDLDPTVGDLDPDRLALDVDRSRRVRCGQRSTVAAAHAERAGLGDSTARDDRTYASDRTARARCAPGRPSSSRSAWPRRRGRRRASRAATVWASTSPVDVVDVGLEQPHRLARRRRRPAVASLADRRPARRSVVRRCRRCRRRSRPTRRSSPAAARTPSAERGHQRDAGRRGELAGRSSMPRAGAPRRASSSSDRGCRVGQLAVGGVDRARGRRRSGCTTMRSMPSTSSAAQVPTMSTIASTPRPRGTRRRAGSTPCIAPSTSASARNVRRALVAHARRAGRRRRAVRGSRGTADGRGRDRGRAGRDRGRRRALGASTTTCGRGDAAALHRLERQRVAVEAERRRAIAATAAWSAPASTSAPSVMSPAVPAKQWNHARGRHRAPSIRRATAQAAPKPLSMPTTVTPLAHDGVHRQQRRDARRGRRRSRRWSARRRPVRRSARRSTLASAPSMPATTIDRVGVGDLVEVGEQAVQAGHADVGRWRSASKPWARA